MRFCNTLARVAVAVLGAGPLAAQQPVFAGVAGAGIDPEVRATRPPWLGTVSSALVPGAGQLLRGQDRGVVYLVAEAFFLQRFVSLWSKADRDEARYRDLAFRVARAGFQPVRADTVFEYFEQMGVFVESGEFDTEPGPALIPPTDENTYNGRIWALARKTFFSNPNVQPDTASSEFRTALDFYRRRAVGPNFRWSWRTAPLEQDVYRQSISQGDEAFRRATAQLGLLLVNHFLSMVDAVVSQRLAAKGSAVGLAHRLQLSPGSVRLDIGIRIGQ